MKKVFLSTLLILLALPAGRSLSGALDGGGPKIAAKELHYDFGAAGQGVRLSHVFEIKNEGTGTLIIERVQSS